jgi:hypothetical protein
MSLKTRLLRPSFVVSALAALASVLLLVATPARATPIVIDNFQIAQSGSAAANGDSDLFFTNSGTSTGSFGGLDERSGRITATFFAPSGQGSGSFVVGSGTGTVAYSSPGSPQPGDFDLTGGARFFYSSGGPENWTLNGNNTLKVTTGADVAFSGVNNLQAYVVVRDTGNKTYVLPSLWQPNTTYEFPYTLFTGMNFAAVTRLDIGVRQTSPGTSAGPFSGTLSLTSISAVPEPGTLAILAAGGVVIATGLVRRRRKATA